MYNTTVSSILHLLFGCDPELYPDEYEKSKEMERTGALRQVVKRRDAENRDRKRTRGNHPLNVGTLWRHDHPSRLLLCISFQLNISLRTPPDIQDTRGWGNGRIETYIECPAPQSSYDGHTKVASSAISERQIVILSVM